jgi:hypothetical protein
VLSVFFLKDHYLLDKKLFVYRLGNLLSTTFVSCFVVSYSQFNVLTGPYCALEIIWSVISWYLYQLSFQTFLFVYEWWGMALLSIYTGLVASGWLSKWRTTGCKTSLMYWSPVRLHSSIWAQLSYHLWWSTTFFSCFVVSYSQFNVLTGPHCVLEIIWSVISWYLYQLSFQTFNRFNIN